MTTIAIGHPGLARKFERKTMVASKSGNYTHLKSKSILRALISLTTPDTHLCTGVFPAILTQSSATCVDAGYNEATREQF